VNSVCILFLLIGVLGMRPGEISSAKPPALPEIVPVIVEPPATPEVEQPQQQQPEEKEKPETPQVVVVTLDSPAISFSVPTIGNLVAPNALATPPPLNPIKPVASLRSMPVKIQTSGAGGERPAPPYPKLALEQGEQGSVVLSISVDDTGSVIDVEVKQSSGYSLLDRNAVDYVKKHWMIPPSGGAHWYETTINFHLKQ
jgi:protein TonB